MSFGDVPERNVAIDFDAECAARPGEVLNEKTDQIITWKVGDAVLTELIIRLCNDFPTTEREVLALI